MCQYNFTAEDNTPSEKIKTQVLIQNYYIVFTLFTI